MPLTSMPELVAGARGGIGAFNVIQLEHAEAIVRGADDAGLPAILQISENCVRYHGALAPIATATLAIAEAASVPVAVHLDHAVDADLVREAVELGIGSVMFDASALDYEANVAATAAVVGYCHRRQAWVEAELGEVGGKDGVHAPGARTDPGDALTRDAALDEDLIAALRDAVPVPLVLHGASGVSDDGLARAVARGIVKVNVGTQLNKAFTAAVRDYLAGNPDVVDPRKYLEPGRAAMAAEVARLLGVLQG